MYKKVTDPVLCDAVEAAGEHLGNVIRTMIDGVAFPVVGNNRQFIVFTHEGDDAGFLLRSDVEYAINFMRRRGRVVGKCYGGWQQYKRPGGEGPAYTFAWVDWYVAPKLADQTTYSITQDFFKGISK